MDYINIHKVPGRIPGETGLDIRSTKKLKEEEATARARAKYLNSKKGMMMETAKMMPKTAMMMAKKPFQMMADQMDKWIEIRQDKAKPSKEMMEHLKNIRENKR